MKVYFPFGGLSDNYSFEEQPPQTSVDALNVRAIDKVTGRLRGAQRGGMDRLSDQRLSADGKVSALAAVTVDERQTISSEKVNTGADSFTDWSTTVTGATECRQAAVDFQGNVFALNGLSSITKYNSEGEKLFEFSFPIEDDSHVVRTLTLDEFGVVYVAVTDGDSSKAGIAWARAFVADDERGLIMLWEHKPGGYIDRIALKDSKAFLAVNIPETGRSKVVVLDLVDTVAPTLAQEWPVPFPLRSVAVNQETGDAFTAHPDSATRAQDPRFQDLTEVVDDIPAPDKFLADFEQRCFAWLRADKIKEQFGFENIQDGDAITLWEDVGPRKRANMREDPSQAAADVGVVPPRFVASAVAGKPGVSFTSDARLQSGRSIGTEKSLNDGQPLLLPNKTSYAMFVAMQVADADETGSVVWQQHKDTGSDRFDDDPMLSVNTEEGSTANQALAFLTNRVFYRAPGINQLAGHAPTLDRNDMRIANQGQHDNKNGVVIFTVVDHKDSEFTGESIYIRVNGTPTVKHLRGGGEQGMLRTAPPGAGLPTFKGRAVFGNVETQVTSGEYEGSLQSFAGTILEVLVFRSYVDSTGTRRLLTVPNYNANASGLVGSQPAYVATSNTEVEQVERYLAWKYGVAHLLDDGLQSPVGTAPTWDTEGGHTKYVHAYCREQGPGGVGLSQDILNTLHLSQDPLLVKWRSRGADPVWAATVSGVGYDVALNEDGNTVNVGPTIGTTQAESITVRRILDAGDSFTLDPTFEHTEQESGFVDYLNERPRIEIDRFGNAWIPGNWDMTASPALLAFDEDGTEIVRYFLGSSQLAFSVSVDPREIDYTNNSNTISIPEAVVIATDSGTDTASDVVHHLDLVEDAGTVGTPRSVTWLGVSGGNIVRFTGGVVSSITGGAGALEADASYVSAVTAFSEVYFADGVNYRKFNPKTNAVERWTATGSGEIPKGCRLMAFWRGRMVLARSSNDPFNWHMSAAGDPDDWNQFPAVHVATQAISGNNSEIGLVPDVPNTLIPYDRERLIFGCDHSIHVMWGDPMEGGSIVLLSDITGMAFGAPWCKDSSGVLYFFGSRGGVYAMTPGEIPIKISSQTIDRRLTNLDLSALTVLMVWDDDDQQLIVLPAPYGAGGTIQERWCWEKKTQGWHEDRSSTADVQPTSVIVLDGDEPEDRIVAFGCEDGFVRSLSRSASTDDGHPIDSYVTIGPFSDPGGQVRVRNPKVTLARDQGGCWVELLASDTPDQRGEPVAAALLMPGQNPKKMIGARGAYVWLRLRSGAIGQSWALECIDVDVIGAGRKVAP